MGARRLTGERSAPAASSEEAPNGARIQLCGPLLATIAGQSVERALPGRKGRLAFAYLVVHRHRPVARDELIGALWPDAGPATPDAALSTLLTRLRQAVGVDVLRGRSHLELDLGAGARVDLETAERSAGDAEAALAGGRPEEALASAREALAVFERPFLPDVAAPWAEERRRELQRRRGPLLDMVARAALALADPELATAERAARELVEAEPFRESGYALLMDVLERGGDVAEALRVYDLLRERLRDELGVPPERGVTARAERLLGLEAAPASGERVPLPGLLAATSGQPFLGRGELLGALRVQGDDARERERGAVMLAGDAGIGKTRLAAEAAREAYEAGWTVLYGRCDEEGLVPYQPFVEAIGHYVAHCSGELGPDAELGRLIPALRPVDADLAPQESDADRHRLFEAVTGLLVRVMRTQPLMLVLDDLHWADKPTLLLLRHVLRATEECPLLVIGTYRDVELGLAPALAELLPALRRELLLRSVAVGGLSEDEVAALVGTRSQDDPSQALVREVFRVSDGNPFVVEELLRELDATGQREPEALSIPEGVKGLIMRRVQRCGEEAREALLAAAVLGREFRFDALAGVLGRDEDAVIQAVDEAVAARLVTEIPGQVDRFAFSHALTREALSDAQTASRRARVHRRAGETLERLAPAAVRPSELARHFHEARAVGGADAALRWSVAAAEDASDARAYEEAAGHYARALEALEITAPGDDDARCELLLRLAAAHERAGEVEDSRERFEQAAAVARRANLADALAQAALGFSKWQQYGLIDHAAVGLLEDALEALPTDDGGDRARVLGLLAVRLDPHSDQARREAALADASAMARRLGDVDALAGILRQTPYVMWQPAGLDGRLAAARETVALAGEAGNGEWALWGHLNCFVELFELGEMPAADVELERYAALSEELRHPWFGWHTPMLRATRALFAGRLEDGRRLAANALELRRRHDPGAEETHVTQMLMLTKLRGQADGVDVATVEAFVERYPARPVWRAMLIDLCCTLGMEEDARRAFAAAMGGETPALPRSVDWLTAVALLAEAAATLGDDGAARRLYELLAPFGDRNAVFDRGWASWGSVSRALGRAAACFGDHETAAHHLEDALGHNERMGARPWAAHAAHDLAEVLLAGGGPAERERAARLVAAALDTTRELGLGGLERRLLALGGGGAT